LRCAAPSIRPPATGSGSRLSPCQLAPSFPAHSMAFSADAFQWSWVALPITASALTFLSVLCFGGRYWGASAALFGPCIAVQSRFTENAPVWVQTGTLGFLILALAALQLYGQDRSERSRRAADVEISSISTAIGSISTGIGRQENRLELVADAIGRQENRLELVADAIGSLADAIRIKGRPSP